MKSLLRLIHCTALLALSMSACSQSPSPGTRAHRDSTTKSKDFSHRRIIGRQSLPVAAGVRVHADRMFTGESGAILFRSRVFVDASPRATGSAPGWPTYGYADEASWNDARKQLTLRGHVVIESAQGVLIEGTQNQTTVTVDDGHLKVVGPTRTSINTPLRKL